MVRIDRYDSVASNCNEEPSQVRENTVIPISDLETGHMLPTVLRTRITIEEWLNYPTGTTIINGVFIPSQVIITAVTVLLILGCTTAFCVLTALKIHFAVIIGTLLFMCYVLYMLGLTAFTEPGFLPRNEKNPALIVIDAAKEHARKNGKNITVEFSDQSNYKARKSNLPPIRCNFTSSEWGVVFGGTKQFEVSTVISGSTAEKQGIQQGFWLLSIKVGEKRFPLIPPQDKGLRYCWTCKIARPERSKHCSDCNACCQKFDHHCPWTGTCIGLRNYTYFVRFVSSLFALIFWILAWTISNLVGLLGTGANSPGILFLGAFLGICIICVGGLGCYHFHLISQDRTTAESRRGVYRREGFEPEETENRRGCLGNCAELCFSPLPPSAIISLR